MGPCSKVFKLAKNEILQSLQDFSFLEASPMGIIFPGKLSVTADLVSRLSIATERILFVTANIAMENMGMRFVHIKSILTIVQQCLSLPKCQRTSQLLQLLLTCHPKNCAVMKPIVEIAIAPIIMKVFVL